MPAQWTEGCGTAMGLTSRPDLGLPTVISRVRSAVGQVVHPLRWELTTKLLARRGLQVRAVDSRKEVVDGEPTFREIRDFCEDFTMTSEERMYALHASVNYVVGAGIPGDFVECGVWRGGSAMIIALSLLELGVTDRRIYLYDRSRR